MTIKCKIPKYLLFSLLPPIAAAAITLSLLRIYLILTFPNFCDRVKEHTERGKNTISITDKEMYSTDPEQTISKNELPLANPQTHSHEVSTQTVSDLKMKEPWHTYAHTSTYNRIYFFIFC